MKAAPSVAYALGIALMIAAAFAVPINSAEQGGLIMLSLGFFLAGIFFHLKQR